MAGATSWLSRDDVPVLVQLSGHPVDDGVEARLCEGVPTVRAVVLQCFRRSRALVGVCGDFGDVGSVARVLVFVGRAQQ